MQVAKVAEFGAIGDNVTDDAAAIQSAVDAVTPSGGIVWLDPYKSYAVGSQINVRSFYPVFLKSDMVGGANLHTIPNMRTGRGCIRPLAGLTGYIFNFEQPSGESWDEGGGGGIYGLNFFDLDGSTLRNVAFAAAVNVHCVVFRIYDCQFAHLDARAIRLGTSIYTMVRNLKVFHCGGTGKPAIDLDGGGSNGFMWVDRAFVEACQYGNAQVVRLNANCGLWSEGMYFENSLPFGHCPLIDGTDGGGFTMINPTFSAGETTYIISNHAYDIIDGARMGGFPVAETVIHLLTNAHNFMLRNTQAQVAGTGKFLHADGCNYGVISNLYGTSIGQIDVSTQIRWHLSDIYIYSPASPIGVPAIDLGANSLDGGFINGQNESPSNGARTAGGRITGATVMLLHGTVGDGVGFEATGNAQLTGCTAINLNGSGGPGGVPFQCDETVLRAGCYGDTGTGHKNPTYQNLVIPLSSLRIDSTAAILDGASTPEYAIDGTDHFVKLVWPAGDNTRITGNVPLLYAFDGTRNVNIGLWVRTDNSGGGGIDAASFEFFYSFDAGTQGSISLVDSTPAVTVHGLGNPISAGNVPDTATGMSFGVRPGAHASDPVELYHLVIQVPILE